MLTLKKFDDLNIHNLITFKSYWESFNSESFNSESFIHTDDNTHKAFQYICRLVQSNNRNIERMDEVVLDSFIWPCM